VGRTDLAGGGDLGLEVGAEVGVAKQGEVLGPLPGQDALGVLVDGRAQVVQRRGRHQRRASPRVAARGSQDGWHRRAPRHCHGRSRRPRWRDGDDGGLDDGRERRRRGRHGARMVTCPLVTCWRGSARALVCSAAQLIS
jgi:hypothetical protein